MPVKRKKPVQTTEDLLRDLLIVQLGLAGVTQHQIREIVGVDIYRVNRIVRHLKGGKPVHDKSREKKQIELPGTSES